MSRTNGMSYRRAMSEFIARGGRRVRNMVTGNELLCCYRDCLDPGDDAIQVRAPHEQPRWPGEQIIYIFCSDGHKAGFIEDTRRPHKEAGK